MDPADGVDSGREPTSSMRRRSTQSEAARSDDGDYDLSASAVADGFRPSQAAQVPAAPLLQPAAVPSAVPSAMPSAMPPTMPSPSGQPPAKAASDGDWPSAVSKPLRAHDSLTLRNDGSASAPRRPPDSPDSPIDGALILPESPYRGATGPSHPYSLYPQRTLSNATSSSASNPNQLSAVGNSVPARLDAYGLPTRTTTGEASAAGFSPVAFTGSGNAFQLRQIGPDGEESGGLIGPSGHLEELPPYTRYPQDSFTSEAASNAASAPRPISGAGGLGRATRNPEFSATDDDLPAVSRSRPASGGEAASQHEINTAARDVSEKAATRWQRRARKKLWGIVPYWAIGLFLVGIVIVAVVLGAVIGTVLTSKARSGSHRDGQLEGYSRSSSSDIEPLRDVPPNLPPLVTGAFCLPPLDISQAPKYCFTDPRQSQSWSCGMSFRSYSMVVSRVPDSPVMKAYSLALTARNASRSKFLWGTQPPDVASPQSLILVNDTFERSRGPAWWMKVLYNKTVIVPEDNFPHRLRKRDESFFRDYSIERRRRGAEEGDRPWICTWPDTTMEIFMYPSQNASVSSAPKPPAMAASMDMAMADVSPDPMPSYPMVVKFLERRWCDDPQSAARCRQVEIVDGGREKRDLEDEDGNPIEVVIDENWRSARERHARLERERHPVERRWASAQILPREALELTDCGCLWWST